MFRHKKPPRISTTPRRYTTLIIILIVIVGVVEAVFVGVSSDLRSRTYLISRASTVATSLSAEDIKELKADDRADQDNPTYKRIKQRLEQIKQENRDIRSASLIGLKGDDVFFYANSEGSWTADYARPGQPYNQPSTRLKNAFQNKVAFNEGPVNDAWGIRLSAFAPVVDARTNKIVAMVSIDIAAWDYYWQILLLAVVPLLLAAIPFVGLLRDRKLEKKEWEISNLKSQFVSIASHELRSPLSGMLWAIQSLLGPNNSNLTPQQKSLLQDMYRSTESSVTTINEILDLSIFERGSNPKLKHEPVDLASIMTYIQNTLSLGAQEKQLDIVMAKTWPDNAMTEGDVAALKRAFMNLLSNAIKYSYASSTVTITYRRENNQHIVGVMDRGIGIAKEDQDKIFGGYYRAVNATKTQAHGTGLGLFVSKLIVEQHHGKVWLDSAEGRGTTIFVSLPAIDETPRKQNT